MKLSSLLVLATEEPSEASLYASIAIAAVIIACFVGSVFRSSRRRFAIGGVLFIVVACLLGFMHEEDVHNIRMANIEVQHKVRMSRMYREEGLSEKEIAARFAAAKSPQETAPATPEPQPSTPYSKPRVIPKATPSPAEVNAEILRKYGTPQR